MRKRESLQRLRAEGDKENWKREATKPALRQPFDPPTRTTPLGIPVPRQTTMYIHFEDPWMRMPQRRTRNWDAPRPDWETWSEQRARSASAESASTHAFLRRLAALAAQCQEKTAHVDSLLPWYGVRAREVFSGFVLKDDVLRCYSVRVHDAPTEDGSWGLGVRKQTMIDPPRQWLLAFPGWRWGIGALGPCDVSPPSSPGKRTASGGGVVFGRTRTYSYLC